MPGKWARIWNERLPKVPLVLVEAPTADAVAMVRGRNADAGLVRLPIDRTGLNAIPLYSETTVVMARKDHPVAFAEEVSMQDLADDVVLHPLDDVLNWEQLPGQLAGERPATAADAMELVAAGAGLLIVPQSLARLHHRRDLVYTPVLDAPQSRVALSWLEDETTDLMEQFIGIVRGRTVNSTRGRPPHAYDPAQPKAKRTGAKQKLAAGNSQRKGSGTRSSKRGKPRRGS